MPAVVCKSLPWQALTGASCADVGGGLWHSHTLSECRTEVLLRRAAVFGACFRLRHLLLSISQCLPALVARSRSDVISTSPSYLKVTDVWMLLEEYKEMRLFARAVRTLHVPFVSNSHLFDSWCCMRSARTGDHFPALFARSSLDMILGPTGSELVRPCALLSLPLFLLLTRTAPEPHQNRPITTHQTRARIHFLLLVCVWACVPPVSMSPRYVAVTCSMSVCRPKSTRSRVYSARLVQEKCFPCVALRTVLGVLHTTSESPPAVVLVRTGGERVMYGPYREV